MTSTSDRLIVLTLLLTFAAPVAADTESREIRRTIETLGNNQWVEVSRGDVTSDPGIMAYSGGWMEQENNRFCLFGGGHYNYSGNEVWCFDTLEFAWRRLHEADVVTTPPYDGGDQGDYENYDNQRYPGALFSPDGESIEEARPMSRHTYDAMEYISGHGALVWGGYAWGDSESPWCTQCNDTWLFDSESVTWRYLFDGSNPSPNISPGVGASAFATHNGRLYAKVLNQTWSYDIQKNQWRRLHTRGEPPWNIEGTLEYNPARRSLYFFGGNYEANKELWEYDIDRNTWRQVKGNGDAPPISASNGPGLAFDTKNRVLAVYSAGTVWIFDPETQRWSQERPEVRPTESDYVFGRFRYDARNEGFWLHAAEGGEHVTWFYRYKRPPASQ